MPKWSNEVPKPDGPRSMPLKRTPTNGKLRAAITSPDLEGCPTHFYQGHTMPCAESNCEACLKGVPWAWHGYVGAMMSGTREHILFEFTPQVGDVLKEFRSHHGTLRGCIIQAQRHNGRQNGRVIMQTTPGDLAMLNLPDPPDLIACMAIIWNLNKDQVKSNGRMKGHNRITADPNQDICDDLIGRDRGNGNGTGH